MTIKKSLLLSNILLIGIPILFFVIYGAILFSSIGNRHWTSLNELFEGDENIHSANSLLYAYSNEIASYDWDRYFELGDNAKDFLKKEEDKDFFKQTEILNKLESELLRLGYSFRVQKDGKTLYGTLKNTPALQNFIEQTKDMDNTIVSSKEEAYIKQTYNNVIVYAEKDFRNTPPRPSYIFQYIFEALIYFLASLLLIIVVVNTAITKINSKMVLAPLNKLHHATDQIAQGNFDVKIDYKKDDEFLQVYKSFDNMRESLKMSVQERIEIENFRKTLIADISHDFRTPLTSIKGYVEGLIDNIANTQEQKKRYYKAIYTSTIDLENLVNNLATLSKHDNKTFVFKQKEIDIISYINNFVEIRENEMLQKNIHICVHHKMHTPHIVNLDTNEFSRVLLNIIENSSKHRAHEKVHISIITKADGDAIIISIADDGEGVSEASLEKLFLRFYREDSSRDRSSQGHGLGLAIAKQIIEGHNGTIEAQNDNGLKMILTLPLIKKLRIEG